MNNNNSLVLGNYIWDRTTHHLQPLSSNDATEEQGSVRLTNKQIALLSCLVNACPNPLTHTEIVKQVWGNEYISPESLPQLINRTRKTIGDTEKTILKNILNVGYTIDVQVNAPKTPELENQKEIKESLPPSERSGTNFKTLVKLIIVVLMVVITSFNLLNFYDAYTSKRDFINTRFWAPYPLLKVNTEGGATTIKLDDGECKYEKDSQTMDCRQI
ncbi:hypothetical protein BIY21_08275 [Vibrio ponticus]|uniref:OmpR/PhoB-type domain-containing protein n=1 Tax=Vibrio ponticus TaxID=265668 RepID=A0ABX3FNI4_9VIBR|nr:winged helix-turn-helix domain-containing protein [Vibrio ponticus]OLQ94589.1 hypothetical protein BIY21_08275 [Vibrio ponticus]